MSKTKTLTGKQTDFVQAYCTPGKGYNNATQAAILAGYSPKTAQLTGHNNIKNYKVQKQIQHFKADFAAESKFTREKQLQGLEESRKLALEQKSSTGITSAIREQNEMLGYHRESAPNQEREQARRDIIAKEKNALDRIQQLAQDRTSELSKGDGDIGSDTGDSDTGDTGDANIIKIGETG